MTVQDLFTQTNITPFIEGVKAFAVVYLIACEITLVVALVAAIAFTFRKVFK